MKRTLLLVAVLALALPGGTAAQDAEVNIPAVTYLSGSYARFFPVARDLIVPPGGHVVQILNVFNFDRAAVQAVGHSTPGEGLLKVRIGFGPPHVPAPPDALGLDFTDHDTARASEIFAIRGPRMAVVLDNERPVPVVVSVGVYATN